MRLSPLLCLASCLLLVDVRISPLLQANERPNIVFFFSDDLTTQAISAYNTGLELPLTPHLDRLAREGMLFENSFCGNSICTPSRATVMTGLHGHKNGIVNLSGMLDPERPTWPKALQSSGYTTALFGKWHMKTKPTGFDAWEVFSGQGHYYNPDLYGPKGVRRVEGHSTDIVTDLALDWLESRDAEKPFCLMIQHKAPHRNWKPSLKDIGRYQDRVFAEPASLFDDYESRVSAANHKMGIDQHMNLASDLMLLNEASDAKVLSRLNPAQKRAYMQAFEAENKAFRENPPLGKDLVRWKYQRYMRNYLSCVAGVDRNVGRVLDRLDALQLSEHTLVVYSADQGFYLGEHGWFDKRWAYEESLKMPLIMRWPGKIKAGTCSQALVQNIDYAPTLLEVAGLKPQWSVHGTSLLPILSGKGMVPDDWRKAIYYRYMDAGHGVPRHRAVRTLGHKLIYFDQPRNAAEEENRWELFDMARDPQEMRNVATDQAYASILKAMKAQLRDLITLYDDTDESVWVRGPGRVYPNELLLRPRRQR